MVALQVMIVHPVEQFVTGPVSGGFGLVCAAAGGDDKNKESSKSIAQNPTNFDAIFIVDHPCSGLSGKTSMFREGGGNAFASLQKNQPRRDQNQTKTGPVVPLQCLPKIERGKPGKHQQGDDFLHAFELRCTVGGTADAIGGDH